MKNATYTDGSPSREWEDNLYDQPTECAGKRNRRVYGQIMKNLRIAVKGEYFDQIKAGTKIYEYRLANDYWKKRLVNREYDTVTITLGYPKKGDKDREITTPYKGFFVTQRQHKEFGHDGAIVLAIPVGNHPILRQG